ncbi:MAG: hypothetical protein ABR507_00875 [Actinomycetota bacterium]
MASARAIAAAGKLQTLLWAWSEAALMKKPDEATDRSKGSRFRETLNIFMIHIS